MSEKATPGSPLDQFLVQFLAVVQTMDDGYQPGPETIQIASRLEFPKAFVDALFTSARTRGLVKPIYGRGSKIRWSISSSGNELVREFAQAPDGA